MKKILVLVSFLIVAAACATQPSENGNTTANANKGSEIKSTAPPSEAEIIAKEKATWDAIKKKDWDAFGKMLASDYIEVVDDGVHDKTATLANAKDFDITDVTYSDWKMLPIDNDAVILTYGVNLKGSYKGQPLPPGLYRGSAAWVNRNGEWLAVYFQETMAVTAPPTPAPKATQPAKQAASPMAKPGEAGSDPIANEKLVWDALKSRNYDAFGSYLTTDHLNVEPDAVYDKEGSVKGVSMVDFSKAQVSDWKAVKLNDNAALVTYVITMPGMKTEKEYHSTIWVRRDGKWLALLHQGTPAATAAPPKPERKM